MIRRTPAITLWQPYAQLIALDAKHYETRSWQFPHRGTLLIHSATKWTHNEKFYTDKFMQKYPSAQGLVDGVPLGCILAAVELVAIHRVEDIRDTLPSDERAYGNYADGRFAWELKLLKVPDKPIPAKGKQGIWLYEWDNE